MKKSIRPIDRGATLDYSIITLFSLLICFYTASIVKLNTEARLRILSEETTLSWLLHSPSVLLGIFLLFAVLWGIGWAFLNSRDTAIVFLYQRKILLTIVFIAFWVFFGLNCNSLYHWTYFLDGPTDNAPLWGISRIIRSDEWATWSPFVFSQHYEGYPAINDLISGGNINTSWISVGGIPAWSPVTLFKPLYWGFLLFGLETGFSFLSIARFLLLFWVSFEFALVYTKQNRILSLTAAIALTLSPYIQWWYSQSIAEVFTYAQGMLLCGYYYCKTGSPCRKVICSVLFGYLLGCYIMIAYPAWLISVFYPVLALGIYGLYRNRKALVLRKDVFALLPALLALGLILYNVLLTKDTLHAISNSVYPGSRLFTGKTITWDFSTGLFSLLFPLEYALPFNNECDSSNFLSFSPAGLIFAVCSMIKQKKADPVTLILMGLEAFLAVFMFLGFPAGLAKITLLSQCTRLQPDIAFIDMILLYRHLANGHVKFSFAAVIPLTIFSAFLIWLPGAGLYTYSRAIKLGILLLGGLIFSLIFSRDPGNPKTTRRMCYAVICCAVLAGGFVNPIQKGISCVTELPLIQELRNIQDDDDTLYLVEASYPRTNAPLLAGKRCFNSTTVYPNPNKWAVLDPEGIYRDVYNRFCHVNLTLCHDDTSFELFAADQINLNLSFKDLRKLNIDYLITRKNYAEEHFEDMQLIPEGSTEKFNIYRIAYN